MIGIRKLIKLGHSFIFLILLGFFVFLLCLVMLQEKNGWETPHFGDYKLMIVMSGSMKPAFDTGSIIVVKKVNPAGISKGKIITFRDPGNEHRYITHRVMEVVRENEKVFFITKGDHNELRDFYKLPAENVIGQVTGDIPYLGYLMIFHKKPFGIFLLLLIPILWATIEGCRSIDQIWGRKKELKVEK
ncbi:signal peptidase I [Dehalobacterium formicoaceticum]|uniref:Signal peptidase I n=1 Tax=Dehalobacterium formicoaceticum TaxID=51515 RepID=A0ABT1Y653_9FIRM|nr:signal peptidase I [Dehalobacterium formicoaceticum]MCR6545394.1 signal peptidase I [Dehalobacterium formicoaceticum]